MSDEKALFMEIYVDESDEITFCMHGDCHEPTRFVCSLGVLTGENEQAVVDLALCPDHIAAFLREGRGMSQT